MSRCRRQVQTPHTPSSSDAFSTATPLVIPITPNSQFQPRNEYERILAAHGALTESTHEDLIAHFLSLGYTEEEFPRMFQFYDEQCNELLKAGGGKIDCMGQKPEVSGDSFQVYPIPGTSNPRLALRMYEGGMEEYRHYILDFFNLDNEKPVNTPRGYRILPDSVGPLIELDGGQEVRSWETAFGVPRNEILPGEEKFSLPEGSYWRLVCGGELLMRFFVPTRPDPQVPGYVQPISYQPRRS